MTMQTRRRVGQIALFMVTIVVAILFFFEGVIHKRDVSCNHLVDSGIHPIFFGVTIFRVYSDSQLIGGNPSEADLSIV